MKRSSRSFLGSLVAVCRAVGDAWNRFWFTPTDPTALAAVRICTGLVLLYVYLACTPELPNLVGPHAWLDAPAYRQFTQQAGAWTPSVWAYVESPAALWGLHTAFLVAIVCFTLGLGSRVASVLVWIGHLSHVHRAVGSCFGMDCVLAMLTFYLMFGPTGAALSLDRVLRRRRQAKAGAGRRKTAESDEPPPSWGANVIVRLIQVHLCVIYLCAGLSKLQGARWWDGTAVWLSMMMKEFAPVDMGWLASWGTLPCLTVSALGVALTLGMEISFAFLIWNRTLRPVLLALAVLMHGGIGAFMGMGSFGAAMLSACLAFVAPATVRRVADRLSAVRRVLSRRNRPASPAHTQARRAA